MDVQALRLFKNDKQQLEDELRAAQSLRDAEVENFNRIALQGAQASQNMQDENKRALFLSITTQRLEEQTTALEEAQESFRVAQFQLDNLNDQQTDYIDNLQTIANANGGVANSNQGRR